MFMAVDVAISIGALFLFGWILTRGANNQKVR
jgi:hypothetical protein